MLGQRCYFDLIMISQNWRRADIWPMSEQMKFMTSWLMIRKLLLGRRCYFDLIMISQNWRRADIWPMSLFRPDYDIAKLTSGRHLANVGKDGIHIKSANCQKTDMLGRRCFLDLIIISGNWRQADINVGKDEIYDKSANDQKIDVGRRCYFDLIMISKNRHRADIWPMTENMTFMTSRQNVRKLMLDGRCYFDLIMISQNYNVGPTSGQCRKRWHSKQVGKLSENCCWADVISTWLWSQNWRRTDIWQKMTFIIMSANCPIF